MKPERFTAGVFILVVMGFMMMTFYAVAEKAISKSEHVWRKHIDWEALYPFKDGVKQKREAEERQYSFIKNKVEVYTSEKLPCYDKLTKAAKAYENFACWNMVSVFGYNAVIKLKDGYLTTYTMSRDVTHNAEAVKGLSDFCAECGIGFMYINFPGKICKSEDKEISGVLDFANQNADKFLSILKDSGVKNYDLRKNLHAAGMKHHEAFYITDHHWKAETGLWAAGEILKILRDDFGWNVEPEILSPGNFEHVIYRDWFLGSHGKKITLARTNPEDFTMIYPKFRTSIQLEIPSLGMKVSGDFGITYDMEQVEPKDYYKKSPYGAYSYGEKPLIRAENELIKNGKKILVIRDSFCECVIPFLLLGVQHVDTINLRYFDGSVHSLIDKVKPDTVIIAYHSNVPGQAGNHYDFR